MNLMRGIDLKKIAEKMNGASGAELKVCLVLAYMKVYLFKLVNYIGVLGYRYLDEKSEI